MRVAPKVEEVPLILFLCLIDKYSGNFFDTKIFPKKRWGTFWKIVSKISPKKSSKIFERNFLFIFLELTLIYYLEVGISVFKLFLASVLKNAAT